MESFVSLMREKKRTEDKQNVKLFHCSYKITKIKKSRIIKVIEKNMNIWWNKSIKSSKF